MAAADIGYRALFVVMALELILGGLALRRVREPIRAPSGGPAEDASPAPA